MKRFSITDLKLSLRQSFRISRGVKTHAHLVRVAVAEDGLVGHGECCPYPHYGETPENVKAALENLRGQIKTLTLESLQSLLSPGAARNALDCALWDLAAKQTGVPVHETLGVPKVQTFSTFITVTLNTSKNMAADAAGYPS